MTKLAKPPIVEARIEFEFDSNEEKRRWDFDSLEKYVQSWASELPRVESRAERQLQVEERTGGTLPRVIQQEVNLQAVRLSNDDKTRFLQIRDDAISVHLVRSGGDYPGFSVLRDDAIAKLARYIDYFRPKALRQLQLYDVDIFDLPFDASGGLDWSTYFTIAFQYPEVFGNLASLRLDFTFMRTPDDEPLTLVFRTIPMSANGRLRFRLDWRLRLKAPEGLELSEIESRLNTGHERVKKCFFELFTPRALEFFEPLSEP